MYTTVSFFWFSYYCLIFVIAVRRSRYTYRITATNSRIRWLWYLIILDWISGALLRLMMITCGFVVFGTVQSLLNVHKRLFWRIKSRSLLLTDKSNAALSFRSIEWHKKVNRFFSSVFLPTHISSHCAFKHRGEIVCS